MGSPQALKDAIIEKMLIQDTLERYAMFLNCRDWESFGKLLVEDFIFDCTPPTERHVKGRDEMLKMLGGSANYRHGFVFQMPHGMILDSLEGDRARTRHTLHVKASHMEIFGIYYDALVREKDGVWRLARRDYRITYHDDIPAPGTLYRTFPDHGQPDWYFAA